MIFAIVVRQIEAMMKGTGTCQHSGNNGMLVFVIWLLIWPASTQSAVAALDVIHNFWRQLRYLK